MKKVLLITALITASLVSPALSNNQKTVRVLKCDRILGVSLPGTCRYVDAPKSKNDTQPSKKPRRRGRRASQRTSLEQCKIVNGTYDHGKKRCYLN